MGQKVTGEHHQAHRPCHKYVKEVDDHKFKERLEYLRGKFPWSDIIIPRGYTPSPYKDSHLYHIESYGVYYTGQWRDGLPHGRGEALLSDGTFYKGYFKNGAVEGPCCLHHSNGNAFYQGSIINNQLQGEGRFVDGDYQYEGGWKNSLPNGIGCQTFPNGDIYKGDFKCGVKDGKGQYTWWQGPYASYQGRFADNYMEGKGTLLFRDGSNLEGEFVADEHLNAANATLTTRKFIFKGDLPDLRSQQAVGKVEIEEDTYYIFQGKKLQFLDMDGDQLQMRKVLNIIEQNYVKAVKHSEALTSIQQQLPQYECRYWRQGDDKTGLLIVPICGRSIQVLKHDR